MAKTIEVVLTESKPGIGLAGEVKRVKLGYFRNFLQPENLAMQMTQENQNRLDSIKKQEKKRLAEIKADVEKLQRALDGQTLTVSAKAQENGNLYGSVTREQIADLISKKYGVELDAKLLLFSPIKVVSELLVKLAPHPEHHFSFTIDIVAEIDEQKQKLLAMNTRVAKEEKSEATQEDVQDSADAQENAEAAE